MQGLADLVKACLVIVVAMTVQDVTGTVCVVAEADGQGRLAGLMDAAGDVGRALTMSVTTDAIIHGIGVHSVTILAVTALTSYNVTSRTTKWARKLKAGPVNPLPPDPSG